MLGQRIGRGGGHTEYDCHHKAPFARKTYMKNFSRERIVGIMKHMTARRTFNLGLNALETKMRLTVLHSLPQTVDIVVTRACNLKSVPIRFRGGLGDKSPVRSQINPWGQMVQERGK